jgi:hypothetical protein
MTPARTDSDDRLRGSVSSRRILIAALVGILFLTLYPFRFDFNEGSHSPLVPFLLNGWGKNAGIFDMFLNVLLFVPYGFGLALQSREKGKSMAVTLGICLAGGALFSYVIELLQYYIPMRDSGWEDVFTNSTGSVVGSLLCGLCGTAVLGLISDAERLLSAWLSFWRAVLILTLYLVLWFTFSFALERQARLSNWLPDSLLIVGNARSPSSWRGEVYELALWDHALPDRFARSLTSGGPPDSVGPRSLAEYDFSATPPFQDQRHFLPDLDWIPETPSLNNSKAIVLNGESWVASHSPVSALVNRFQTTRQFSLRMRCKPAAVAGIDGSIVSIAQVSGPANLELRQDGGKLVFWFRTPLTRKRSTMAWQVPNIFEVGQARDLLLSYDGLDLALYVDGQRERRAYQLGPGAALAQFVRRIKANESEGYQDIFYVLIFFPAGCIVGFAWRNAAVRPIARSLLVVSGVLLPPLLFEIIAVRWGGQVMSLPNMALWVLIALAGSFWINADGGALRGSMDSSTPGLAR